MNNVVNPLKQKGHSIYTIQKPTIKDMHKMSRFKTMNKKVIELFDEKTGDVIRTFCFRNPKEFYEFAQGFNEKKHPGYGWRYKDKRGKERKK